MTNIKIMDMVLANMIAAGEVVERPASVVKELMENAIDANANLIIVEVNNIGLESISVTDNGDGMAKDDLDKSFLRHATSKVTNKNDLERIRSLGFRGEALAAIASVSNLTISSKLKNGDGNYIEVKDSKIVKEGILPMNKGTKVIVSDLFYNTPARFKYLRSEISEKNYIINIFEKISLANPHISFKLIIDNSLVKQTIGNGSINALIESIYGNVTKVIKHLETSISKVKIDAYLVSPEHVRSRKSDINIFINNRYVRNYILENAIIAGYNTFLMTNKDPISFIYLTIDPSLVDVNVHPRKTEVKLANELLIAYAISPLIKETLEKGVLPVKEPLAKPLENYKAIQFDMFNIVSEIKEEEPVVNYNDSKVLAKLPNLEYVGTLFGTFLIFQNDEGMYLVDQHAAEERIRYEYYAIKVGELKNDFYELLIPFSLNLKTDEINILLNHQKELNEIGFKFNKNELTAHPVWLREKDIDSSIDSIIEQLSTTNKISLELLRNDLAKDVACKASIKANHRISLKEINQLIADLRNTKNPYTCPHGRPVLIKLSNYDIEKMFKRIV